jgi:hypothetical protein
MLTKLLCVTSVALFTSSSAFASAGGCHAISGTYVNHTVPCLVPALTCVESETTTGGHAVSLIVITGFAPATGVFTGEVTSVLDTGAVRTGTIVGTNAAGSVVTYTGGTRQFAHSTGTTVTDGAGNFSGEYCLGRGDED